MFQEPKSHLPLVMDSVLDKAPLRGLGITWGGAYNSAFLTGCPVGVACGLHLEVECCRQ